MEVLYNNMIFFLFRI